MQATLPGVQRALDLEPLLRGALLAQMAAVLLRFEPPEVAGAWVFCSRCGQLVENQSWGIDNRTRSSGCRVCLWRSAERLAAESQCP